MIMIWRLGYALAVLILSSEAYTVPPAAALSLRQGRSLFSAGTTSLGATDLATAVGIERRCRHTRSSLSPTMQTEFEDENAREKLRAMLDRQFGIGDSLRPDEWCRAADDVKIGTVMLANPAPYLEDGNSELLEKFGLAMKLPGSDELPPERAAELLPVVLIVDKQSEGTMGLMMNRRTGVLMGDMGDEFKSFMIQPLWLGGVEGTGTISFLHTYPEVFDSTPITEDGEIHFGGEIESANEVVRKGPGSGFNFRFFAQFTLWGPGELEKEMEKNWWRPVIASKMALMRIRDRKGPDVSKPIWADLSEMAGGECRRAMEEFYGR